MRNSLHLSATRKNFALGSTLFNISLVAVICMAAFVSAASADVNNAPSDEPTIKAGIDVSDGRGETVVATHTYDESSHARGIAIATRDGNRLPVAGEPADANDLGFIPRCGVCDEHLVAPGFNGFKGLDGPPAPYRGVLQLHYAEILLVLDDAFIALHGEDAESEAAAVFDRAALLYQNSLSGTYQLKLSGIISYPRDLPPSITLTDVGNGEISANDLLTSFGAWHQNNRTDIEAMLGHSYDAGILLSGRDFGGSTVGLAWVGGMCAGSFSSGIVQGFGSTDATGNVLAHEIGHTLAMGHDGQGNACAPSGFVMEASLNPSAPLSSAFSSCSIAETTAWLSAQDRICMWNNPGEPDWTVDRCGDGRVEANEECDAGIDLFGGSCCDPTTCYLAPGCACTSYEACCDNGTVLGAGTLCRSAAGGCDVDEFCDGLNGACPQDLVVAQGSSCTSDNGFDGSCYNGECATADQVCFDLFGTGECAWQGPTCGGDLYCTHDSIPNSCYIVQTPDGVECAAGMQCHDGSCVSSGVIGPFSWAAGLWSGCAGGVQSRSVTCINESGAVVSDFNCDAGSKPATIQPCTTFTLADFAAMQRCMYENATGECAALDLTNNTYVNLLDYALFSNLLTGP